MCPVMCPEKSGGKDDNCLHDPPETAGVNGNGWGDFGKQVPKEILKVALKRPGVVSFHIVPDSTERLPEGSHKYIPKISP